MNITIIRFDFYYETYVSIYWYTYIGRRVEMMRSASSGGGGNSCVETPAGSCGSGQSGTGRNATRAIFAFRPFMLM